MVTTTRQRSGAKPAAAKKTAIRGYDSAVRFLMSQTDYEQMRRVRYNSDTFSLDRMESLLKKLGNPHDKLKTVHIAGTKGKGSTAIMLATMLQSCGLKVGLYTSPHILDIRERIVVNGQKISQRNFTQQILDVAKCVEKMGDDKPTFFEIMTAMAFCHFTEQEVDIAVVETGLGGRLDSTNVLKPEVCGLTSISIDHTAQLGKAIADIAREKGGILKKNTPAISVPQDPAAKRVLKKIASENKAKLLFAGDEIEFSYRVESSRRNGCHTRICLTTPRSRFEHLPVPVFGEHQALNCGLALALLDQLKKNGMDIDDMKAIEGLANLELPGRMEMVREDPRIVVDGAHNTASMQALMRSLGQHIGYDSMVMIFGCAADKDIDGMMHQIVLGADKVIFTKATGNPRAAEPKALAEIYSEFSGGRAPQVTESLTDALNIANSAVSREDIICVTGSFYLVGEAKRLLQS